jgi:hypothetical protein
LQWSYYFLVFLIKGKLEWKSLKSIFKKGLNMILISFPAKIFSHTSKLRLYLKSFSEFSLILLIFHSFICNIIHLFVNDLRFTTVHDCWKETLEWSNLVTQEATISYFMSIYVWSMIWSVQVMVSVDATFQG